MKPSPIRFNNFADLHQFLLKIEKLALIKIKIKTVNTKIRSTIVAMNKNLAQQFIMDSHGDTYLLADLLAEQPMENNQLIFPAIDGQKYTIDDFKDKINPTMELKLIYNKGLAESLTSIMFNQTNLLDVKLPFCSITKQEITLPLMSISSLENFELYAILKWVYRNRKDPTNHQATNFEHLLYNYPLQDLLFLKLACTKKRNALLEQSTHKDKAILLMRVNSELSFIKNNITNNKIFLELLVNEYQSNSPSKLINKLKVFNMPVPVDNLLDSGELLARTNGYRPRLHSQMNYHSTCSTNVSYLASAILLIYALLYVAYRIDDDFLNQKYIAKHVHDLLTTKNQRLFANIASMLSIIVIMTLALRHRITHDNLASSTEQEIQQLDSFLNEHAHLALLHPDHLERLLMIINTVETELNKPQTLTKGLANNYYLKKGIIHTQQDKSANNYINGSTSNYEVTPEFKHP